MTGKDAFILVALTGAAKELLKLSLSKNPAVLAEASGCRGAAMRCFAAGGQLMEPYVLAEATEAGATEQMIVEYSCAVEAAQAALFEAAASKGLE